MKQFCSHDKGFMATVKVRHNYTKAFPCEGRGTVLARWMSSLKQFSNSPTNQNSHPNLRYKSPLKRLDLDAIKGDILLHGARPSDGVLKDPLHVLVSERRIALVARLEIKDLSLPSRPGTAASEDLAALEPTEEDDLLGVGNIKSFAVHLLGVKHEGLVNARGNGVIRLDAPNPLSVLRPPLQRARGSHQLLEYLLFLQQHLYIQFQFL